MCIGLALGRWLRSGEISAPELPKRERALRIVDVRFGSEADRTARPIDVRFVPEADIHLRARADLVLRFGLEIAGVMAFV